MKTTDYLAIFCVIIGVAVLAVMAAPLQPHTYTTLSPKTQLFIVLIMISLSMFGLIVLYTKLCNLRNNIKEVKPNEKAA